MVRAAQRGGGAAGAERTPRTSRGPLDISLSRGTFIDQDRFHFEMLTMLLETYLRSRIERPPLASSSHILATRYSDLPDQCASCHSAGTPTLIDLSYMCSYVSDRKPERRPLVRSIHTVALTRSKWKIIGTQCTSQV